jgi:hypothetical protein
MAPLPRLERGTVGLEDQKISVPPVYREQWCLPTPIYWGKNFQAVHRFYNVIRILHQNCTRNIKGKATRTIDLTCEPSGQKPLSRSSRIPDFTNRMVSSMLVAV